jgi:hypothetical protein
MSKLAITPVLVAIEWVFYSKPASGRVLASIAVLMAGITLCTLTDTQVRRRHKGGEGGACARARVIGDEVGCRTHRRSA